MRSLRLLLTVLIIFMSSSTLFSYYNLFTCSHCNGEEMSNSGAPMEMTEHCRGGNSAEKYPDLDNDSCALSLLERREQHFLPIRDSSDYLLLNSPLSEERFYIVHQEEEPFYLKRGASETNHINHIKTIRLLC